MRGEGKMVCICICICVYFHFWATAMEIGYVVRYG